MSPIGAGAHVPDGGDSAQIEVAVKGWEQTTPARRVPPAALAQRADQQLDAATGDLAGRAMSTTAGLPGIRVRVFSQTAGYIAGATTGPDGYYLIHGLPPGSYFVQFVDPTHTYRQQWSGGVALFFRATPVTVGTGTTWSSALLGT